MSVDYYARLVLGFKLPRSVFQVEEDTRGCAHPIKDVDANFCPQCGQQVWKRSRGFVELRHPRYEQFDLNTEDFEETLDETNSAVVFGLKVADTLALDDLTALFSNSNLESELREFLTRFKIPVPAGMKMAVHLVRYVSY